MQILLPADFHTGHRQIVLAYLYRGHEFSRDEWRRAIITKVKVQRQQEKEREDNGSADN